MDSLPPAPPRGPEKIVDDFASPPKLVRGRGRPLPADQRPGRIGVSPASSSSAPRSSASSTAPDPDIIVVDSRPADRVPSATDHFREAFPGFPESFKPGEDGGRKVYMEYHMRKIEKHILLEERQNEKEWLATKRKEEEIKRKTERVEKEKEDLERLKRRAERFGESSKRMRFDSPTEMQSGWFDDESPERQSRSRRQ